jgi:hypothetical protein
MGQDSVPLLKSYRTLLLCWQVQTTTPQHSTRLSESLRLRIAAAAAVRAAVDACPTLSSDLSGGGGDDEADAVAG